MIYQQSYGQMVGNGGIRMANVTVIIIYQQLYIEMVINTGIVMESLFEVKLLKIKTNKETRYSNSDGKRHRNNGPAIIYPSGTQVWYRNDKPHRDNNLPASIGSDGDQYWHQNGKLHRDNGPAIIWSNGTQVYWVNGEFIKREKAT